MILNQYYDLNNILTTRLKCDNCDNKITIKLTEYEIRSGKILWSKLPKEWMIFNESILCGDCQRG